jgi:hypothetical protein
LLEAVVGGFRLAKRGVDFVDCCFESREFAHCVRDLAAPEGVETFIQTASIHQHHPPFTLGLNNRGKMGQRTQHIPPSQQSY